MLLPEHVDSKAMANDMGTGEALTSFTQLPGGGFFDNYGGKDSPQGIRPIIRNCVIGGSDLQRVDAIKTLRGKIGRRGVLTIEWDTGELWWQWARMRRMGTPRGEQDKSTVSCALMWETASQQWYGIRQSGNSWSVGDNSFYLGDGTASLGMNDYLYSFGLETDTIEVTLPNGGNTYARNLYIELITDHIIDNLTIDNLTTGHRLVWTDIGASNQFSVIIDTGAHSCFIRRDTLGKPIASIAGRGPYISVTTTGAHGLTSGQSVELLGTVTLNNIYHEIIVTSSTTFDAPMPDSQFAGGIISEMGTVYLLQNGRSGLAFSDRSNWFLLAPGANELSITHTVQSTPTRTPQIQFRWYDHYK